MNATGSLILSPIKVDGRQLLSEPCTGKNSIYTRYNQTETYEVRQSPLPNAQDGAAGSMRHAWKARVLMQVMSQRYSVYTDPYHNIPRLDMYKYDGSPMNPMYLAFSPPQMLPTTTLNPTSASATATGSSKKKRSLENEVPLNWKLKFDGRSGPGGADVVHHINTDRLWWIGLAMTGVGGLLYLGPRRMGIQLQ